MPLKLSPQHSLFDPQVVAPALLEPGTVPWMLVRLRKTMPLVPQFLASEWRGAGRFGRKAWPADVLLALIMLRWSEGNTSRLGACRRARTDLAWRAGMGLATGGDTPSEKTVREFEQWLQETSPSCDRARIDVLFEGVTLLVAGVVSARIWVMDGTPMFCFGALRGTVRLLGDGLRGLLRRWSRLKKRPFAQVAREMDVLWVTAKSTKGGLGVDWRDTNARHEVVDRLARDVVRVVEHVADRIPELRPRHQETVRKRCTALLKVITDDLDTDETGRLVIARRATADRIVSITDPEARSGRKTTGRPFKGFRLNVLGDLLSGLIVGVQVFPGNRAEGGPGVELLARAKRLGLDVERVLADSAYGGTPVRSAATALGIDLVSPPPAVPDKGSDVVQKHQFKVNFERQRATCPAGHEAVSRRMTTRDGRPCAEYTWAYETCAGCPLRTRCAPKVPATRKAKGQRPRGKRLILHPDEQDLRAAREAWQDPARREEYRRRGEGESLIARMVRFGARKARAFGLAAANLQARLCAMTANLALLARRLMQAEEPLPQPTLPLFPDSS